MTKEGISASHNKEVPIFVVMLNFDILQIVDSPKVWIIRIPDFFFFAQFPRCPQELQLLQLALGAPS